MFGGALGGGNNYTKMTPLIFSRRVDLLQGSE